MDGDIFSSVRQTTFKYERIRSIGSGILESAVTTFILLIAIRVYSASGLYKGLLAGGASLGFLISPLVVHLAEVRKWKTSHGAAYFTLAGGFGFLIAAPPHSFLLFFLGSLLGLAASSAVVPLLTQMYQENYPAAERGLLFSRTFMLRIGVAAFSSQLLGLVLVHPMGRSVYVLILFGAACFLSAWCLLQCPSTVLHIPVQNSFLKNFALLKTDPLFRITMICWMFLGTGNLMMIPMRVEMLANPGHGIPLSVPEIAMLCGVIPNLARLLMSPLWGWLFDKMNFFRLRVILNICFATGILAFFTSRSTSGLIIGALIFGVSTAGGDVAWSLWVTKFAPPERVAGYMSVHTFATGVRGVVAPVLSYFLISFCSIQAIGLVSVCLIMIATVLLLMEIRKGYWSDSHASGLVN
ncbi:MAG: Major Facilitator Superfamily protein [Verrucomicrobiales bacterium]|nr:Major Facilitator Superfamily protein [Verrucomicrobiales bacterium]